MDKERVTNLLVIFIVLVALIAGARAMESMNAVEASKPTPATSGVSFFDLRDQERDLTGAQWDQRFEEVEGTSVKGWQGVIVNVDEVSGDYYVYVEMDEGSLLDVYDVKWKVPREEATDLPKGGDIIFDGEIEDWDDILGFEIELTNVTHSYQ